MPFIYSYIRIVDEENRVTSVASRDRDFARLKMLSGNLCDERLTMEEIKAIAAYLVNNVAQIQPYFAREDGKMSLLEIQEIISRCPVVDVTRQSHVDLVAGNRPVPEDILYRRGKMSNTCTLIFNLNMLLAQASPQGVSLLHGVVWEVVLPRARGISWRAGP